MTHAGRAAAMRPEAAAGAARRPDAAVPSRGPKDAPAPAVEPGARLLAYELGHVVPVGPADDPLEREADQVAGRVVSEGAPAAPPGDPGERIPGDVRRRVEPLVGADLGHVRVHRGPETELVADRIGARAFAYGPEIWLGRGAASHDLSLMAHEITHVLQHERAGGREAGTVRRQPRSDDPAAEDWSRFEAAFQDPNLIAHQRALQELATKRSPRAFDLILSRVNDPWDADHAMEAALAFFIFYPDLALDRLEPATQPAGDAAVTALNGLLAYRASAHGPGPDVAYRKLDAWMAAKDAKEGGALTRSLQRRQVRVTVERMRQTIATSSRIRTRALPGAAAFVQEMDQLLTALPNLAERDVASLHATVMAADPLVSRAESRVDELYALIGTLIVDQNVPADADEIKFIEEELIKPYDDALAKGRDFAAMARLVATADAAYRNQALLYQARKVKQLREGWSKVKYPEVGWPVKNASGMRAGGLGIEQKYTAHVASLTPRVESLLKRHDAGERLPVADLAEVQRDLLTVQLEQAALSDYLSLFLLYEQLVQIEPKGASSHVVSDFDDIKADVRRWNGAIERAVIGGNLKGYVELTDNVDYRIVFKRAQRRAETIEDQQLALAIGVLAVSFLAGWGAGLLVRGGATLAFGAEAVAAGSFGARVLAGAEFVGNVAAFTLTSEALQSATFGTKFDAASLPGKMAENAVMFWVFGRIGKLTGGIGKGATGPLMKVLGFGLRQSVNLALFTGVGALGERVLHGQWPRDWKRFMVQSVAAYAMLSVLGKTLEPLRAKLDQRLLEPVVAKRLATLDARLEALGQQLADMTGTSSATGEATVKRSQGEALRQRIKELCGDYRKLLDFLKTSGAIKAAEADPLYDSLAQTEKAMTDAVLTAERASIVALDRIGELRPTGDGVNFTYQARRRAGRGRRSRAPSGLDKALTAFGAAGYEIETNAESGEIAVYQPGRGELVARFTPDIGAIPEAAAKGKPARTPKEVMQFLRDAGFSESEIISFGGADAKRLGSRSAARVSRLAEKFTLEDLKALAQVLWKYDVVLTDAMADQLLKLVEAGRMEAFLRSREAAAESAASVGLDVDFEESLGLSVEERGVRKPRKAAGDRKFDAPWRLAEKHTGAALEATFGGGWVAGRRFFAPTAAEGELLGSTVPEYYRKSDNTAVEVKRWNLAEMGIDPARADRPRGAPSTRSVEALGRARRQQENRRWALPGEAEGVPPAKTWIVLDIRAQGVTDPAATGANLKTLLADYKIVYDKVMVLTEGGLLEIK